MEADLDTTLSPAMPHSFTYRWLAGFFSGELSAEAMAFYRGGDGAVLLEDLAHSPPLEPFVEAIRSAIADCHRLDERRLDLAAAFAKLFLGAGGPKSAPPYESAYRSESGMLFQEPMAQMAELLRQLDMSVADTLKEPPDHIAIELNALAILSEREEQVRQSGEPRLAEVLCDQRVALLDDHLLAWLPDFAADCAKHDSSGFYAAAANAVLGFSRADRTSLNPAPNAE